MMITSRSNALVKKIKLLKDKKFRDQENLYIVEGAKSVETAIKFGQDISVVVGTNYGLSLIDLPSNLKVEIVSDDVFKAISGESTPQGILALLVKPENIVKGSDRSIFLDGVADPGNVGAIIRTAVASGYKDIYITDDSADAFSPKAVRASMTGIFSVNVMRAKRSELLSKINSEIIIADMDGVNVFDEKAPKNFCLVIGNEANGVSETVKEKASIIVSIPMEKEMESLNASVSAGILMYALKQKF